MALNYLLITYGEEPVKKWVNQLAIFRLCTAYPHPNDMKPERFLAKVKFSSEEELNDVLDRLSLEPENSAENEDDSTVSSFLEQNYSGPVLVNGIACQLTIEREPNSLIIEVSGTKEEPFKLDESVFQRALKLDRFLDSLALPVVDPPQDDKYCISPKYYPEAFD